LTPTEAKVSIKFPKTEFSKIPKSFSGGLSLKYRYNNQILSLGRVIDLTSLSSGALLLSLEIRKDETPLWYFDSILASAKGREILLVREQKCLARHGKVSRVSTFQRIGTNDIVYPIEASITIMSPRKKT